MTQLNQVHELGKQGNLKTEKVSKVFTGHDGYWTTAHCGDISRVREKLIRKFRSLLDEQSRNKPKKAEKKPKSFPVVGRQTKMQLARGGQNYAHQLKQKTCAQKHSLILSTIKIPNGK